jgi:hypothetical protein
VVSSRSVFGRNVAPSRTTSAVCADDARPEVASTWVTLGRRDLVAAAAFGTILLIGAACRVLPGMFGSFHDDAIYVLSAKAIATGHGYRLINLPGAPPQTKYPILYPLVLAGVWRLWPSFPQNGLALHSISMLAGAFSVALAYLYMVRFGYCSRAVALATGLIIATAPVVLFFSVQALSEMPFAVLLVIALWSLEYARKAERRSAARDVLVGVVVALPFLCRTVGIIVPIVGGVLLHLAGRRVRWMTLGTAAVMFPWMIWSVAALAYSPKDPILSYYTDYPGDWLSIGLAWPLKVVTTNVLLIVVSTTISTLQGIGFMLFRLGVGSRAVPFLVTFSLLTGCLSWATVAWRMRRRPVLPSVLLGYGALVVMWPWNPNRFLIPILPFLIAHVLSAVSAPFNGRAGRRVAWLAFGFILCGIITANVWAEADLASIAHASGYSYGFAPDDPVSWASYQRSFEWLRAHTRETDIVASGFDSMVSLYTERAAFRPFRHRPLSLIYGDKTPAVGTVEEFSEILKTQRANYVLKCPLPGLEIEKPFAALIASWRAQIPNDSRLVYEDKDPRFMIFEVLNTER